MDALRSLACVLLLAMCAAPRGAQAAPAPDGAWPSGWEGRWTGAASTRGARGEGPAFTMSLDIGAVEADGRRGWTLTYAGAAGEQVRRYTLLRKDATRGLYAIDEGNGIVIPMTFVAGALRGLFEVQGTRLAVAYRFDEGAGLARRIGVEIVTTAKAPSGTTGGAGGVPPVEVWDVVSVQSATLFPAAGASSDLQRLADWMTGTFTSTAQSAADPEYRDITLAMGRIWPTRDDGPWLYVEQAVTQQRAKPYRQRVYQLVHTGGDLFESRVFSLPDPASAIGAAAAPERLAGLSPAHLVPLEGCTVVLRRLDATTFRGSTLGAACANEFQGATYATSEVSVTAEGITSWDRGYDAKAVQVWGATLGPYRFLREVAGEAPAR